MVDTEKEREIWRTYPDYPFIEVSNLGIIRTKDRVVTRSDGRKLHIKGRVLKQYNIGHGYMQVQIGVNGKTIRLYVHRVIATCFVSNPNNLPEVNHIDNDPTNNRFDNLEWCTHEYNMAYKEKYGKSATEVSGRPVIAVNQEASEVFWFKSQREAARQLGVRHGSMGYVLEGKRNQTHGYYFCNADSTAVEKTRAKFGDKVADKVKKMMGNI